MFGCIGRIVVVCVLLALGAVAYATRDRWEPALAARVGIRASARNDGASWQPITPAGAARAQAALDTLRRPTGAAFVNVKPADLVAFALGPVVDRLVGAQGTTPPAATPPAARSVGEILSVRGSVRISDLGGAAALGPLAGVLDGVQDVELRGRIEVTAPGHALLTVTRVAIGNLVLPGPAIGRVVQQLAPRKDKSAPEDVVAFSLPAEVADIRVHSGRITVYKAAK